VVLNLEGNMNSVLDSAIAKSRILNSELGKVSRNASAGSRTRRRKKTGEISEEDLFKRYPHIPSGWQNRVFRFNSKLERSPLLSHNGFLRNVDRTFKNLQRFSDEFLRNSFTLYGVRENFANAVKVISSFSRTAGAAVPAIGTAGSIGKSALIGQGIPALAGGLGYWAGMRTLKSQSMQEAAANNMRYNMARHSLGEGYDDAFRAASDIAVSTGSSRVGTLDLISTLTGLNVGGKLLSQEQASYLANITAKLAHASNRDMGVVGLNMQQILTSWQGIDIKELIKSVPLIGKFLQDERRKAGSNEDIYAFVRSNPQAFFRALEEFNKTVKISPVAMARGQIALNRENFFLKLEKLFEPVAERMADANTKLYDILGEAAEEFFSEQNLNNVDSIINNFLEASKTLLGAAAKFGNAAINVGSWTVENPWTTTAGIYALFGKGSLQMKVATIVAGSIIDQANKVDKKEEDIAIRDLKNDPNGIKYLEAILPGFKYAHYDIWKNIINGNPEYDNVSAIVADYRQSELSRTQPNYAINLRNKAIKEAISNTPVTKPLTLLGLGGLAIDNGLQKIGSLLLQDMITQPPMGKFQDKYNNNKYAKQLDKEIRPLLAKEYDQSGNSIESLTDSFDTQSVGQSDAQTIRGMSGTTRALVINFNREIVSMPTTINANDVEDIKQQLEPAIEDMIVRGLTIALNNSTRMI
jgi:hypothetical protein